MGFISPWRFDSSRPHFESPAKARFSQSWLVCRASHKAGERTRTADPFITNLSERLRLLAAVRRYRIGWPFFAV